MQTKFYFLQNKHFITSILICLIAFILMACGNNAAKALEQIDLGYNFLSEENYEEAILAFTKAIKIDDQNAEAYVGRANAYIFSNETDETFSKAEADYKKALELDHKCVNAYLGLADLAIRQNDLDKALQILEDALTVLGSNNEISKKIDEIKSGSINDLQGRLRRMSNYDSDGNLKWYHLVSYDEEGRKKTISCFDANNIQTDFVQNQYDEKGNITYGASSFQTKDGLLTKGYFKYDNFGNVIEITDDDGSYTIYDYNDLNKVIQKSFYNSDGTLDRYIKNKYDNKGNLSRYEYYNKEHELEVYELYKHNNNGQCIRQDTYNSDGTLINYIINEFNDEGSMISSKFYNADGSLKEQRKFE